jgi:hypothetical protein
MGSGLKEKTRWRLEEAQNTDDTEGQDADKV